VGRRGAWHCGYAFAFEFAFAFAFAFASSAATGSRLQIATALKICPLTHL
jgi:hypothetical protein